MNYIPCVSLVQPKITRYHYVRKAKGTAEKREKKFFHAKGVLTKKRD